MPANAACKQALGFEIIRVWIVTAGITALDLSIKKPPRVDAGGAAFDLEGMKLRSVNAAGSYLILRVPAQSAAGAECSCHLLLEAWHKILCQACSRAGCYEAAAWHAHERKAATRREGECVGNDDSSAQGQTAGWLAAGFTGSLWSAQVCGRVEQRCSLLQA
eukprot:365743-Chlamydomonas_euryale.AAC.3